MDFLTLCQRLRQETGIADSGPSSVTGQAGDMKRLVDWINESWLRIQSSQASWNWMWLQSTATATVGDAVLTLASDVERVAYLRVGDYTLTEIDYDTYRQTYQTLSDGRPTGYAVRPDGVFVFNTLPDHAYNVVYEYYSTPAYLVNNIDVPAIPQRFHMLIVWGALMEYALFDEAVELAQKARINYEQIYAELVRDQSQEIQLPGAIA